MNFAFNPQRGLIIVRAELFGSSGSAVLRFALDTGATSSLVSVGLLTAIGYDPSLIPERVQITTGSGVEFVPRVPISKVSVLGQERFDFSILAHTLPPSANIDGLLGLDFFRQQVLTIDFTQGQISLR